MFFKIVTVAAVGLLTAVLARKIMQQVEATKARARVYAKRPPQGLTKLRRDPETGIYHPES